jgi:hypothetical protein
VANSLSADKALIFRIVHLHNVPWLLDHGVHCRNSASVDPDYVSIGNAELITKRSSRQVPVPPGGTLSDYVPFYFTPYSPMMLNIKTGYGGIRKRANEEIVILASSLHRLSKLKVPFVFSDRHAYLQTARFSSNIVDLSWIDWGLLQRRDFKRDPNDSEKVERYQAEALVHTACPVEALVGIACYNQHVHDQLAAELAKRNLALKLVVQPGWYF